jgi:uncharacterized protein (DUF2141 family)
MVKLTLFTLICCFSLPKVTENNLEPTQMSVEITGLKSSKGHMLVTIFDQSKGFPDDEKKAVTYAKVKPQMPSTKVEFKVEPNKKYAIAVLHDEDDNGEMTYGLFMPKEAFGFSNNPKVVFKKPGFDDAAFQFSGAKDFAHKIILKHP